MPAKLVLRDHEYQVRAGMTIRAALQQVDINPDTVLPTRDGELLTDDEILVEDDHIKLVAVISGGSSTAKG